MPSGDGKMRFILKEYLALFPSSDMLNSAMQAILPYPSHSRRICAQWRGIDAASPAPYLAPYLYAIPASLDGKMQLPPGQFPPYLTPSRGVRTQTHNGKAAVLAMVDLIINRECSDLITATDKAETEACNRATKPLAKVDSKRMCLIGGSFPDESLSTPLVSRCKLHRSGNDRRVELDSPAVRFLTGQQNIVFRAQHRR